MSLRGRLWLGILSLCGILFFALQLALWLLQSERQRDIQSTYQSTWPILLSYAYDPRLRVVNLPWIRNVLAIESLREWAADCLISTGRAADASGFVDLNPLGAAHRDHERFPLAEIQAGIERALTERRVQHVAGGFCVPVPVGERATAAAWFVPKSPPPPTSFRWLVLAALLSVLALGWFAYWSLGRSVVKPLEQLGQAATRLGSGDYSARADIAANSQELALLVSSFNTMAGKVDGHTEELAEAVRRATEETARRERALTLSSRLASMGTLAAGIAHEINNPIGGMLNAIVKISKNPALSDKERVYVNLIQEGLERITRISRRVLEFTPRQIAAQPFDLRRAVEAARALVEHRLRHENIQVQVAIPADLPALFGEIHEIQQVLLNLFLNAADAFEGQPLPRQIQLNARRDGEFVVLEFDDNGPGVAREVLSRLMDPFFSQKNRPDASGLGLFISYSIVKNHGGEIELDSAPGQGFHVRIRLPVVANSS